MSGTRKRSTRKKKKGTGENRRFAQKVTLGLVVVGGLIALVVLANRWSAKESVRTISISGNEVLDSAEIAGLLDLPDQTSLSDVDLAGLERRVLEHPFIKGGVIWKGSQGLVLEVEERTPVAVTVMHGRAVYLDDRGVPLPFRFGAAAADVPVLEGVVTNGEPERFDSAAVAEGIAVATALREYGAGLDHRISTIGRAADGEITLRLVDGNLPVRIGPKSEVAARLPKLDAFLNGVILREGTSGMRGIDLRWRGQVVVSGRSNGSEA